MMRRISFFDEYSYMFQCANPDCGETFNQRLGSLLYADKVVCPKCGAAIDITESKRTGDIGKWFDTATELDKKVRKKK